LAPFGDWDVPKGFAKNGDAIEVVQPDQEPGGQRGLARIRGLRPLHYRTEQTLADWTRFRDGTLEPIALHRGTQPIPWQ